MARLKYGLVSIVIGLAPLLIGCERPEQKAAPPEAAKAEPTAAAVEVAEMTDDQLCIWMCNNCYGEYAGLVEYPGDCHAKCKAQITTERCAEQRRAKVRCQVQNKRCDACDAEEKAVRECFASTQD
jgi:hypothetical protein